MAKADSLADQYHALWDGEVSPDLEAFLSSQATDDLDSLCEVLRVDLRNRWSRNCQCDVNDYLTRFPAIRSSSEHFIDLVYANYLMMRKHLSEVDVEGYASRFPEIEKELLRQIQFNEMIEEPKLDASETETVIHSSFGPDEQSTTETLSGTFGRYEIESLLGRGGMGRVYLAYDTILHRKVAIKIPSDHLATSETAIRRFYREARTSAGLRHTNIASVYDAGEINDHHFLSMEFIEGETLAERIRNRGPLDPTTAIEFIIDIASAVDYAHSNGIIHRDLKPANIMLNTDRVPIVTDFGLAHWQLAAESNVDEVDSFPSQDSFVGTPAFAAPEQFEGKLTAASDYYALGGVLYFMLTGKPPFQGKFFEMFSKIKNVPAPKPSLLNEQVSPELDFVCQKLLEKEPENRYESIPALVQELRDLLDANPLSSTSKPVVAPAKGVLPKSLIMAAVVLLLAASITTAFFFRPNKEVKTDPIPPGSHWAGTFSFDGAHFHPVDLTVTESASSTLKAIYRTEEKFEWMVEGIRNQDTIKFQFIDTKQNSSIARNLVGHGRLDCTIRGDEMEVKFVDSSDGSSTNFLLKRLTSHQ